MSEQEKKWSAAQIERTRDTLERIDVVAFSFQLGRPNKGCGMDHLDGRYGYITLKDAMNETWKVFDYDTDELYGDYGSIQAVIDAGWKVST